jgi:hypothetical protein
MQFLIASIIGLVSGIASGLFWRGGACDGAAMVLLQLQPNPRSNKPSAPHWSSLSLQR